MLRRSRMDSKLSMSCPSLEQIPYDLILMGAGGYAFGCLTQVNPALTAALLAVSTLANHLFFQIAQKAASTINQKVMYGTNEAIYAGTNAIISTAALLAARHFALISSSMAGCLIFVTANVLLCRMRILADYRPISQPKVFLFTPKAIAEAAKNAEMQMQGSRLGVNQKLAVLIKKR